MKTAVLIAFLSLFAVAALAQSKSKTTDTSKTKPSGLPSPFRMRFTEVFKQNADASWSPIQPLMVNGEMVPTSTRLKNDAKYGGLILLRDINSVLLVDTMRGVVIVHGFVK